MVSRNWCSSKLWRIRPFRIHVRPRRSSRLFILKSLYRANSKERSISGRRLSTRTNDHCLTGRQYVYQTLSLFSVNKTLGHSMNLNALLHVELYNDHHQMFNQSWEETTLGSDLDELVVDNLHERQVRTSTLMKNALTLYQSDTVLKMEPRSYQKWRTLVNDKLEHQQQKMLSSQKRALKRPMIKAKIVALGRPKGSCSQGGEWSFWTWPGKERGKGKGHRSRSPVQRDISAERQYARKTGKSSWKRRSPTVFQLRERKWLPWSRVWSLASSALQRLQER